MAEISEKDDALPRCSTLFLTEDGSPMLFYMTPSAMKTRLRPLIHHGGGELSSKVLTDSIKLADPHSGGDLSGYISTDYIFDSIKHNRLQDLKKYRLKPSGDETSKSSKHQRSPSPSTIKIPVSKRRAGRHVYTNEEDLALILFVQENKDFYALKGNSLYKKAAYAKVTSHPWQSMRDHYLKVLKPQEREDELERILKANTRKLPVVMKGKSTDSHNGQSRSTREQPSKHKKVDLVMEDFSPCTTDDGVTDDSSPSDAESVDCDKVFDDNLLQLAKESTTEKGRIEIEGHGKNEQTKHSSSQEPKTRVITRKMMEKMSEQENILSDFDGEVYVREDSTRHSTDDEEDKRPIAKRTRRLGKEADKAVNKSPASKRGKRDGLEVHDAHDKSPEAKRNRINEKASLLNGMEDEEVKRSIFLHFQALHADIQKLESHWTVPQIIHALLLNSGMLDDAETYLQCGTAGKELWSSMEDKILLSKDKEAIANLVKTRGLQSVLDRINFIEGID